MQPTPFERTSAPSIAEHEPPIPERRMLREQIKACCVTDDDLNAFVLDYFPAIYRNFAGGMTREAKVTLLLEDERGLPYVAKAVSQLWALRMDETRAFPLVHGPASAPRPRRGKLEQEVLIEEDFNEFSPDKLAGLMHVIQRLVGQEFKVVLRNCRAGSVILTLRGDWRALSYLMEAFDTGRLRTLYGYRVLAIRWVYPPNYLPLFTAVRQSMRAQFMHGYLLVGRVMTWIANSATIFQVPRWVVIVLLIYVLGGAAWATHQIVRIVINNIAILLPVAIGENSQNEPPSRRQITSNSPSNQARHSAEATRTALDAPFDLKSIDGDKKNFDSSDLVNNTGSTAPTSRLPIAVPVERPPATRPKKPRAISPVSLHGTRLLHNALVSEYLECVSAKKCKSPPSKFSILAMVPYADAIRYCRYAGNRLPTQTELILHGAKVTHITDFSREWTDKGEWLAEPNGVSRTDRPAPDAVGYIRCIEDTH
jgi:hypothetical protein